MKHECVVLMHNGIFVDANRIDKGIYESEIPHIFRKETTIESLNKKFKDLGFTQTEIISYNLSRCRLQPITVSDESSQPSPGYSKEQMGEAFRHGWQLCYNVSNFNKTGYEKQHPENWKDMGWEQRRQWLRATYLRSLPPAKDAGVLVACLEEVKKYNIGPTWQAFIDRALTLYNKPT